MKKYIQSFRQYKLIESQDKLVDYDDKVEDNNKQSSETVENTIQQLNDFKTKRTALERLIMNNRGEESKDISKNIDDIVEDKKMGKNPFLSMYVTILTKDRKVLDLQDKLDYFNKLEKERLSDINATKNLSDASDREEQKQKLEQQIEDIKEKVRDMKKDIDELESEISKDKSNLDKHMKDIKRERERDLKDTQRRMK